MLWYELQRRFKKLCYELTFEKQEGTEIFYIKNIKTNEVNVYSDRKDIEKLLLKLETAIGFNLITKQ
jgi:ribosomal protein S8